MSVAVLSSIGFVIVAVVGSVLVLVDIVVFSYGCTEVTNIMARATAR